MKLLTMRGSHNPDGSFNWKETVIDASVSAGLTFFTSLGGLTVTGLISEQGLVAAGIAACTEFFAVLAIKRGIREKEQR